MDIPISPSNQELIVRYLLGELPEKQQVEIEDQAFQDQQYLQNILAVENDLIDEYVRGEIPLNKRQKFESHFLASAERRRKVEFARALCSVVSENEAAEVVRPISGHTPIVRQNPFLAFIRSLSPAAAFSFATAALLVVTGATWLIRDGIMLRSQLSQLRAEQQSQEAQRQQLQEQIANERSRNEELAAEVEHQRKQEVPAGLPREEQPSVKRAPTTVALMLLPGLSRGSNQRPKFVIPQAAQTARLQVVVDPQDDYPRFLVELRTQRGQRVWGKENLSARATGRGRTIVLNVPAKVFAVGQYELSLKGTTAAGIIEDVGYYYFEVSKQ
jgi:hypothetical protein